MNARRILIALCIVCLPAAAFAAKRLATPSTNRTIIVQNQCPATIIAGLVGGAVTACTNGSCPSGSQCNTANNQCFWSLPAPTGGTSLPGSRVLLKSKTKATYELTNTPYNGIKMSGTFYAETGCTNEGNGCQTAPCPGCGPGVGPQGPATIAEFTFLSNGPDAYDVSMINGINLPLTMAPASVTAQTGSNIYFCQTPGALTQSSTGLPSCSWSFTSPSNLILAFVAPGGTSPCPTSGCASGQVCGYSGNFGTGAVTAACGKQIGWWTANELCGFTANAFGSPINCTATVSPSPGTMANLLACNGPYATSSCYTTGASTTCCGCPAWSYSGLTPTSTCQSTNPQWTADSLPWATFVKNGCPTGYSFQFDDPSSSFTCNTANPSATTPNTMGYTITFCPGGKQAF